MTRGRLCECVYTHKCLGHTEKERKQAVNIISGLQAGVYCLSQQIERVLYSSPLCQLKISGSERDFITFIQSGKRKGRLLLWKCACTNYCNHPPPSFLKKKCSIRFPQRPMIAPHFTRLKGQSQKDNKPQQIH